MIEVLKEKKEWNEQLKMARHIDFYHTYDYHQLSKKENESPILIKYTEGSNSIAIPLLLRSIENSNYKDAISVYGYAGIIVLNIDNQFKKENFHKELKTFFKNNDIVSVFSRLHPYLEHQESILDGLGKTTTLNKVVYIDLNETLDNQRKMFNRRLKTYINKSRKTCTVIESKLKNHIKTFVHLYHENMKRVNANSSYFFNNEYFDQLLSSKDFDSELLLCIHNDTQEIIAGAIFIKKDDIVQYHLSGLNDAYLNLNPIKLIINEERIKSTNEGFKYFNLGGGRGNQEDSLFSFKSSFSKKYKTFRTWKYVVDENAYSILAKKHFGNEYQNIDFFPVYRANKNLRKNLV